MRTLNVELTDRHEALIERLVSEGKYRNASEVLGASLSLVERVEADHATKVAMFREAVQAGVDCVERGEYVAFDDMDELHRYLEELGERVIAGRPTDD